MNDKMNILNSLQEISACANDLKRIAKAFGTVGNFEMKIQLSEIAESLDINRKAVFDIHAYNSNQMFLQAKQGSINVVNAALAASGSDIQL